MNKQAQRADDAREPEKESLLNGFSKKRNRIVGKIAGALALLVCLLAVNPRVAQAADDRKPSASRPPHYPHSTFYELKL